MLSWLNHYLGIDWGTYIGLGLTLVALFLSIFISNKRRTINQKANIKGGASIQVGGNLKVGSSGDAKSQRE